MTRLILIEAILFLIPFALYFGWRAVLERKEAETGGRFDERPWQLLIVAGGVLALGGLVAFALTEGRRDGAVYIPARIEDGQIVRGRFVTPEEAGDLINVDPKARANPQTATGEGAGGNTPRRAPDGDAPR